VQTFAVTDSRHPPIALDPTVGKGKKIAISGLFKGLAVSLYEIRPIWEEMAGARIESLVGSSFGLLQYLANPASLETH
jgi:hypothetical protein